MPGTATYVPPFAAHPVHILRDKDVNSLIKLVLKSTNNGSCNYLFVSCVTHVNIVAHSNHAPATCIFCKVTPVYYWSAVCQSVRPLSVPSSYLEN